MGKVFIGSVSVVMNTRGEIALRRDPEGKFSAADAAEIYDTIQRLSKAKKAPVNKYSLFVVNPKGVPVLLANRYGNPYLAVLPPGAQLTDGETVRRRTVQKLA